MNKRDSIPRGLKLQILIEAGHRCAISTCRHPTTEIAHIIPWRECKEHTFENLIALCPNCHTRYDRGEIERKAMLIYKNNLAILNSRYSDLEKRILKMFSDSFKEGDDDYRILVPRALYILLKYLIDDGIIIDLGPASNKYYPLIGFDPETKRPIAENMNQYNTYKLTEQGVNLIRKLRLGQEIQ